MMHMRFNDKTLLASISWGSQGQVKQKVANMLVMVILSDANTRGCLGEFKS